MPPLQKLVVSAPGQDFSRLPTNLASSASSVPINPLASTPSLALNKSASKELETYPSELKERIETLEVSVEIMLKEIAQLSSKGNSNFYHGFCR